MKNVIKKIVYASTILAVLFAAVYSGAGTSAVHKVKSEPISIMTTREIMATDKIGTNQIVIEKCLGVVDTKRGDGHVSGKPDWYMWYGDIRYKGKRLKPGTKVLSYFPCDPLNDVDPIARYDFIKVKDKNGQKHWKLVHVLE